jgi:low temperature requirement protein LtrA
VICKVISPYLWWSVGIYDKEHRRLSRPYIGCYSGQFHFADQQFIPGRADTFCHLLADSIHQFFTTFFPAVQARQSICRISIYHQGMTERLGLITIIVFGENILGVINGINDGGRISFMTWMIFGTGILIVFLLWWIYFSIVADREVRKGFWRGQLFILGFIPILASLGAVGATFSVVMEGNLGIADHHVDMARIIFGVGLAIFLWSVVGISKMLIYPPTYDVPKLLIQRLMSIGGILILGIHLFCLHLDLFYVFLGTFLVLLLIVIKLVISWFKLELQAVAQS